MGSFRPEKAFSGLLIWLLCQSLDLGHCLNDEGRALLSFRERVAVDPYGALSNWVEGVDDHCSWFGVECSDDGREVVALKLESLLLEGVLAPELGKLIHLKSLILRNNSFHGTIPKEIGELRMLEILDLGHNNLSGPFPSNIGSKSPLKILVLRSNGHMSSIPPELRALNMISELQVDDGHSSSESFAVKRKTDNATIRKLRQEVRKNKHRHHRNRHLGPSNNRVPIAANSQSGKKHKIHLIVFLSVVAGSFLLIALSAIFCLCCRANKVVAVMPWRTGLSGQLRKAFVTGVPSLRRSELESACEDFSNVVGSLSDCFLYKGTLSSGVEIAVTSTTISSAKDWSDHYEAQFRKKIAVLSKVNHKNFMNLIGFCEEEEPFTRMMVYEYAPNGTLFEHLHVKEADHLDWAARLRIIMGIAYCLDHMHQLDPPAVLRNLTSSSIYLCDDYAAKVSDLSFCSSEEKEEAVQSLESSGIMDPQSSSQEGNVYKLGIILLEIISGRLPFSEDDGLLVLWASSHLNGKRPLVDMVDTTLTLYSEEDMTELCEVIKACIEPDPKKRPTMSEVIARLRHITSITPEGTSSKLSPLWWAELEIISAEGNSSLQ